MKGEFIITSVHPLCRPPSWQWTCRPPCPGSEPWRTTPCHRWRSTPSCRQTDESEPPSSPSQTCEGSGQPARRLPFPRLPCSPPESKKEQHTLSITFMLLCLNSVWNLIQEEVILTHKAQQYSLKEVFFKMQSQTIILHSSSDALKDRALTVLVMQQ